MAYVCFARDYRTKRFGMIFVFIVSYCGCLSSRIAVNAQINGFRIESAVEEAAANPAGGVSIVRNRDVTIRIFTVVPLTPNAQISFTTISAEKNASCEDLRSTPIFNVTLDDGEHANVTDQASSALAAIRLSTDQAVYMFCLRMWPNSSSMWLHQGNAKWLRITVSEPASTAQNLLPTWTAIVIIAVLIVLSSLCTALGIETLSLSRSELKVLRSCGVSDERRFAKAIGPLRKRGNRVLCGLLFFSIFANACIAVLVEDMMQLPGAAMVVSAGFIFLLSTLLPLIVSSRVGLLIAARSSWLVNVFVAITLPISYPFGRLLDWILDDDLPVVFDRNRMQCLQLSSQTITVVKEDEKEVQNNSSKGLRLSTKCVKDLMTNIDDVFMVEYNGILDEKTLDQIFASGYTRIPVYEKDAANIVALLHVRDLAYVRASDKTSLRSLCKFYNHPVNFVFEDTNLEVMLEEFKKGQSHMAFVQRVNCEGSGDPFYETLGMVTLEDVIESIFKSEVIVDPPDVIRNNTLLSRDIVEKTNVSDFTRLAKRSKKELSAQMETAVCQFLSTLIPFREQLMSQQIVARMLKQDVVVNIDLDSDANHSRFLYERGCPSDCFSLVVDGRVKIHIGNEGFVFEGGSFMYFGLQALVGTIQGVSVSDVAVHNDSINTVSNSSTPYIPDYTVEAITPVQLVRISVAEYKIALRAAALEYHIHDDNASSGIDIYAIDNGSVSLEHGYTTDDGDSSIMPRSRSQLLNHCDSNV